MKPKDLLNKHHPIRDVNIKKYTDHSYTLVKETKNGIIKTLKPQAVRAIKERLGLS